MTSDDILCVWLTIVIMFAGAITALAHWDVLHGLRVAGVMTVWALLMHMIWREPK